MRIAQPLVGAALAGLVSVSAAGPVTVTKLTGGTLAATAVPEPATLALLAIALVALALALRRKK